MPENDESERQHAEINDNLQITEVSKKSFSFTVEIPLFLNMLSFGLTGN